jgi:hypothetical protein
VVNRRPVPGDSPLKNLAYLAAGSKWNPQYCECAELARMICKGLGIEGELNKKQCEWLVGEVLKKVIAYERKRAVDAGLESINWGRIIGERDGERPFLVAGAGELLKLGDEFDFLKVRHALKIDDAAWDALLAKEKKDGGEKRFLQLRAGLWLRKLDGNDYASKRARGSEVECRLFESLIKAIVACLDSEDFESDRNMLIRGVKSHSSKAGRALRDGQSSGSTASVPASRNGKSESNEEGSSPSPAVLERWVNYTFDGYAYGPGVGKPPLSAIDLATGYIRRFALEAEFERLVGEGARLLCLVGQAGMGKSCLARMLVGEFPFIEFQDGRPLLAHLRPALKKYGLSFEDLTHKNAEGKLVDLLTADPGPEFVGLDNVPNMSKLRYLVPHRTTSVVVATCRSHGHGTPEQCREIVVGPVSVTEARYLIASGLPVSKQRYAENLASIVGYHPLMIRTAINIARATGIDLVTIGKSLAVDPGSIRTDSGEKLLDALGQMVEALREYEPAAVDLLALLASNDNIERANLPRILMFGNECYGPEVGSVRCVAALELLLRLSLVDLHVIDPIMTALSLVATKPVIGPILRVALEEDVIRVDAMLSRRLALNGETVERLMDQENYNADDLWEIHRSVKALSVLLGRTENPPWPPVGRGLTKLAETAEQHAWHRRFDTV